jgi:hypothetical protein
MVTGTEAMAMGMVMGMRSLNLLLLRRDANALKVLSQQVWIEYIRPSMIPSPCPLATVVPKVRDGLRLRSKDHQVMAEEMLQGMVVVVGMANAFARVHIHPLHRPKRIVDKEAGRRQPT